ncbi:MAG: aminotransferase class I/II-fold pyridoxal phosphate-dependent enzyme [Cyanobacteria bacterium J06642_2]
MSYAASARSPALALAGGIADVPTPLDTDFAQLNDLIDSVAASAKQMLQDLGDRPVGRQSPPLETQPLPERGMGAIAALETFSQRYAPSFSGSAGPRYFGFVTGGVTPAALLGDWLTATYDQNATGSTESSAPQLELETLSWLRDLFGLSAAHTGTFVTGATISNFVSLAIARQWLGQARGLDIARQGVAALGSVAILSGTPHSSTYKAAAMLGLGRDSVRQVPTLSDREAVDVIALDAALTDAADRPCIVVANAGTVNTVDFDDLKAIAALKQRHAFWLHVDAAFGGFAACSPQYRHWVAGMDAADSITIDAHKWLNVPYDAAMQFSRHFELQAQVFQNAAAYLQTDLTPSNFIHLTPENSRRLRALSCWFSLLAYGCEGYAELVNRHCRLARELGDRLASTPGFQLLAPVNLNGICFSICIPTGTPVSAPERDRYLDRLNASGLLFLTPTTYRGIPAMRVSITNWRTGDRDIDIAWQAMQDALDI